MEYTPDNDAHMRKRLELISLAKDQLGIDMSDYAEKLVDSFCKLSPPKEASFFMEHPVMPSLSMGLVKTKDAGQGGGRTRKPGNILLNWRNMARETGDLVLAGVGTIVQPWLIPFAALSIFNKLWTHATIELSKEQASCLFAMWHRCDDDHKITCNKAFKACNELFVVFQWANLQDRQFSAILDDLIKLQCIKIEEEHVIWLRESVQQSY